jgi:ankyrin repeat protein
MGGMTALLLAARDGKMAAVKALVEAGVDLNQRSPAESSTPLIISIANGWLDVGKYLLEHGANPNEFNKDGLTPLYATIDIEYAPLSWAPAPTTIAEKTTYLELMDELLQQGANPNARLTRKLFYRPSSHDRSWVRPEGTTAFWRAALSNDVPSMKLLIKYGADPSIASDEGVTALMAAAGIGWVPGNFTQTWREDDARLQAVQYCIDLGLDVNAVDKKDQTALHGAAWAGDHKVIQLLVDKKAKLDVLSKSGWYVTDMPNGVDVAGGLPTERPETVNFLLKLGAPAPVAPKAGSGIVKKRP